MMGRLHGVFALTSALLFALPVGAEDLAETLDQERDTRCAKPAEFEGQPRHVSVALRARFGLARTPFAAPLWPEQVGYRVFSFIPAVRYTFSPAWYFGLRAPLVEAFVQRPAGTIVKQTAVGNVEVSSVWRTPLTREPEAAVAVAFAVPTSGNSVPAQAHYPNAALALGSALEAWRYPELFSPGRLPVIATGRLNYRRGALDAAFELKLPWLVQVQRATDHPDVAIHPVALVAVMSSQLSIIPLPWLYLTARGWLVWQAIAPAELERRRGSNWQLALQPQLSFSLGKHALIAVDFTLPVGGELGGRTYSGALAVGARF